MSRSVLCLGFSLAVLLALGCSKAKPVSVSGTVYLDGQLLKEGSINLVGEKGTTPESFEIKEGKFEGQALPGKKRVEIRAFRQGKPTKMGDVVIEGSPENYIPERFNTSTTLTAEVSASGINPNKFEVQSK